MRADAFAPSFTRIAPLPQRWRRWSADAAVLATTASVLGLFLLSPITLEAYGFAYLTPGGGPFSKVHPSTILAVVALLLRCFASRDPVRVMAKLAGADADLTIYTAAIVVVAAITVAVTGLPFTPLIDTFVLPLLIVLLLRDLDPRITKILAVAVALVLCVNAGVAIAEMLSGWRLVPIVVPYDVSGDPTRSDMVFSWQAQLATDWRARALLGHPLENGLITGSFLVALAAKGSDWLRWKWKAPLILLQAVAMFAFGARTALVLATLFCCGFGLCRGINAARRRVAVAPRTLALALMVIALAVIGGLALLQAGFFDQTIERFGSDEGSAGTRLTMFTLLGAFPPSTLLFAPDPEKLATLMRMYGLESGIESSWVGLILNDGLLVTGVILIGLAAFTRALIRLCGSGVGLICLFVLVQVSVTASLSGKTTSVGLVTVLALVFLRRDLVRDGVERMRRKGV